MAKKKRHGTGTFLRMPHDVMKQKKFLALKPMERTVLFELAMQYNGHNNGDLCAAPKTMRDRGINSKSGVEKALAMLEEFGFIMKTRQGGRHMPNLWAITWQPIDECSGKLEVPETNVAPGGWRDRDEN